MVIKMSRCKATAKEIELLARLMRAETLGEGNTGMLLVANVGVNRVVADCNEFKKITSIKQMVYQKPSGFEGANSPLFNTTPRTIQKDLAKRAIRFWRGDPATYSLWFRTPINGGCQSFYGNFSGRYKNHCFYDPEKSRKCNL